MAMVSATVARGLSNGHDRETQEYLSTESVPSTNENRRPIYRPRCGTDWELKIPTVPRDRGIKVKMLRPLDYRGRATALVGHLY
ncbi:uncharacterized protein G2W53_000833 [Senna tora]|uniref:Uncharacterized protein n=1 Tax=Senna tora TaxID=362788 RepID=A0A834XIL6_9FABA|nr:uncharacterized protein G2W53_000833 [Senna tora]